MRDVKRIEVDGDWADATIVEPGDYVFAGYCMKNEGRNVEDQIAGAFGVLGCVSRVCF